MIDIVYESMSYDDIPEENKHGNCFQTAVNTVMENPNYILCHGVVCGQGPISGIEYLHAWAEDGDTVIDNTQKNPKNRVMDKVLYYALGNIHDVCKYSYREMLENLVEYEHYGPWDDRFEGYL